MHRTLSTRARWLVSGGLVMTVLFGRGTYDLLRLSAKQRKLDRRLSDLFQQHERLVQEQGRLESDPAYVEGLIRTTFKVSQRNEYVVSLDPSSSPSSSIKTLLKER